MTHQNQLTVTLFCRFFAKQNLRIIALVHSPFRKDNLTYYNNYHLLNCQLLLLFLLTRGEYKQCLPLQAAELDIKYRRYFYSAANGRCGIGSEGTGNLRFYIAKDKHYNSVYLIDFLFSTTCPWALTKPTRDLVSEYLS